ncbi:hypothetical protein CW362_29955 [Streptomyces populi]|uniref:Uncharacterized protein n=1 Tax=Streptomyces populi TaxID=2058924 RepID=A0A2I0SHJ8_9ACTN|nr:hypothetical protein [Streptomyces populi]PKT69407.1 hypothetical protein CW362_29955 [Streptomyces populi]
MSLALLLSACGAEFNPLFVESGGSGPVIGWRVCPGARPDGIAEVGLYRWDRDGTADDPGELLWHIEASHGITTHRIRLGSSPRGFTTRLPLSVALDPASTYALRTNMSSDDLVEGFLTFRPRQLRAGSLVFSDGRTESRRAYDGRDDEDFGCFSD